ncbi:MAG: hypothetical protein HPY75_05485 [Actinobacteria bacterium]|nr:hypothetical protein [Actinomycetota bacterium]
MRGKYYSQYLMRALDGEAVPLDRELEALVSIGERVTRAVPAVPKLDEGARRRIWESAVSAAHEAEPHGKARALYLRRVAWVAAACLVALAAVFTALYLHGGGLSVRERVEVATLRVDRGEMVIRDAEGVERIAQNGETLAEGETVLAAKEARGWIKFESGSFMRLLGEGEVAVVEGDDGVVVEVREGRTYHRVAEGVPYTARYADISVTALGTAFALEVEDGKARVLSIHSSVEVEAGEDVSRLEEGDALAFGEGADGLIYDLTREHLDDEWFRWNKSLDEELGLPVGILRILDEADREAEEEPPAQETAPQPPAPEPPPTPQPAPQPTPQPAPQPPAQKSLALSASAREGAVDFTWTLSGYSGFQGFKLCRSENNPAPAYPGDWWKYIDGADTRSATDTSVEGGHTYYYRLAVYNQGEVLGYSNAVKVTVPGQSQELSISLTATVEAGKVRLSWSVSGAGSYDGFKVCRSETNTNPSYPGDTCTFVDAGSRSYADTSVSPGHTYYYRVGIYKGGSILVYSNAVKAVVP